MQRVQPKGHRRSSSTGMPPLVANTASQFPLPTFREPVQGPSSHFGSGLSGTEPFLVARDDVEDVAVDDSRFSAMGSGNSAEVYGFVGWIGSYACIFLYFIWAFFSDDYLHGWGIYYYPSKYWAVAIPVWLLVALVYSWVAYHAINLVQTPALNSVHCFTDELFRENPELTQIAGGLQFGVRPGFDDQEDDSAGRIDPIADLPLSRVNEIIFDPRLKIRV